MPTAPPATTAGGPVLVLGPLLRHAGRDSATVWVETDRCAVVTVWAFDRVFAAHTFRVHGHHYALVILTDLPRAATSEYRVAVAGVEVWPPRPGQFPPSVIRTIDPDQPTRFIFGSCRTAAGHDAAGNAEHGVDALRTCAFRLLDTPVAEWPDLLCLLGDQVYADETPVEMRAFIESRRDPEQPPWYELKDFIEYAQLYRFAWSDDAIRWLLATIPSVMIFDDHDIRDDWNTSAQWHREMNAKPWWHERITGGLASYWVYQHIGNLSPSELAHDEIFQHLPAQSAGSPATFGPATANTAASAGANPAEPDLTELLTSFAARVDRQPETYRWSYARDLGDSRLVMVDSRAARVLDPARRSIVDPAEMAWLDDQLRGDVAHLFVGTSLPFLLLPALHDLEAIDESAASGAWGRSAAALGERARQSFDLEHWAAFAQGFADVLAAVKQVAAGQRGRAPVSITFLSGDVHHSYVAEFPERQPGESHIIQAVCSPMRNPMPKSGRTLIRLLAAGVGRPISAWARRSPRVPAASDQWTVTAGPWFDNCLATVSVAPDSIRFSWETGVVTGAAGHRPESHRVAEVTVPEGPFNCSRSPNDLEQPSPDPSTATAPTKRPRATAPGP